VHGVPDREFLPARGIRLLPVNIRMAPVNIHLYRNRIDGLSEAQGIRRYSME